MRDMRIRTFQPGDEVRQTAIYNAAACDLYKFKPATTHEVQRRTHAPDFDPTTRFYAEEGGQVVGYVGFHANGRVSYPWCVSGYEQLAEPLFEHLRNEMKRRGLRRAVAAYRRDWTEICDFFTAHGFRHTRDMVNCVVELLDMPTVPARPGSHVSPITPNDLPAILAMMPGALRAKNTDELERHLFHNEYFGPDCLFALRSKADDSPVAVAILITEATYADPRHVDAGMPCFRLGAFGTEGMDVKRIKGMFSFLARNDQNLPALGLDLMSQASLRLRDSDDIDVLAA